MFEANNTYTVKVKEYGCGTTPNDKAFAWVKFTDDTNGVVTWRGWLTTAKAKKNTATNLLKLGWNKDFKAFAAGEAGCIDTTRAIEIETELDTYEKKDGTEASRVVVKWINLPGEGGGFTALKPEKVHVLDASMKAAAVEAEQENKFPAMTPPAATGTEATADIPF